MKTYEELRSDSVSRSDLILNTIYTCFCERYHNFYKYFGALLPSADERQHLTGTEISECTSAASSNSELDLEVIEIEKLQPQKLWRQPIAFHWKILRKTICILHIPIFLS